MPKTSKTKPAPQRLGPTTVYRPSASWSPEDDRLLIEAHAQGITWKPLSALHFPEKSPNACRKRHERLMERRNAQSWDDGIKQKELAVEYVRGRSDMWSPMAARLGEKWQFVESKCMEIGLSNLISVARGVSRRSSGVSGMDEYLVEDGDSGIAMEDEAEAEMDAARRRQSERQQASTAAATTRATASSPVATTLQQPPSSHHHRSLPQPSQPLPLSSSPPTAPIATRSASYGPTIASLLSPSSAYP